MTLFATRKSAVVLLLFLVLAPGLAQAGDAVLRIGILPVLDTLPLQVAVKDGLFEKHGLDVKLIPFSSALERDTAMQSGRLDGYFGDLINTLLLINRGVPMRIATVCQETSEGQPFFALLLAPGVNKGAGPLDVGISRATIIELLLDRMRALPAAAELDFRRTEIKKIPIRLQMLLTAQLDAAVLPEPLASLARSKGASIVVTDEKLNMPLTVICLHDKASRHGKAFLRAYGEATRRVNESPDKHRGLMVETCRIPKPLEDVFPMYAYPAPRQPDENEVFRVQQWMLVRGMLSSMLDYESMLLR